MRKVLAMGAAPATGALANRAAAFAIHLLGQPRFMLFGEPHRFVAPPRTLPLLAYLLLHRGAHLTRESIALALWADASEEDARANLRRHLHHLKEALPPGQVPWCVAEGETLRWNVEAQAWVDVDEFEQHLAHADLERAVGLYAGDLAPSIYDDWIVPERDRLRSLYVGALEALLLQARSRRQFTAAAEYARRILNDDPWREDTLRQLMSIRYESGDRTGALHEFGTFVQRLRGEMGAEPMADTVALRDIMLRGGGLPEHSDVIAPKRRNEKSQGHSLPFVGRAWELERLHSAWARTALGHGGILLIAGEAGIGKSRLSGELALFAAAQGGRVLRGSTSPAETTPYQAIREVLRDAAPMLATLDLRPIWLSVISILVPEFAIRHGVSPPPSLDPDQEQQRLFEALAQTFEALAKQRPLLVVLEDVHAAGASSVAAFEYLARRAATQALLIVATYRTEAAAPCDPVPELRRRLTGASLIDHIALAGLSHEEVANLVAFVPDLPGDRNVLSLDIAKTSEGNPLFVGELIRNRIEVPSAPEIPHEIGAAISARAARVSASAKLLLEIASVIGLSFDVEYVRAVSGYDENAVLDGLAELLDRRMIRETAVGPFEFVFTHHLVQQTIYDGIQDWRRTRWHRRIAGILERVSPPKSDDILSDLARHWDLAGDCKRAAHAFLRAARRALSLYAHEEALREATRGIDLAPEEDPLRFELLLTRQAINSLLGDRPAQECDLDELQRSETCSSDIQAQCRVLERLVKLRHEFNNQRSEYDSIRALTERAESLADDHWRAVALELSARHHLGAGQHREARIAAASAAALHERTGDTSGQVSALHISCLAAANLGAFDDAAKQLSLLDKAVNENGVANLIALSKRARAHVAERCEDYVAGQAAAIDALELYQSVGDRLQEARVHTTLGAFASRLWQIGRARRHFALSCELFEALGASRDLAEAFQNAGALAAELGCFAEATELNEKAAAMAGLFGFTSILGVCACNMAGTAMLMDNPVLCLKICDDASKKSMSDFLSVVRLAIMARAKLSLGDFDVAIDALESAVPELRRYEALSEVCDGLMHLARAYLAVGRIEDARRCVNELLHGLDEPGDIYPKLYRPRILWVAGGFFTAIRQSRRARELFGQAQIALEELRAAIPDTATREHFSAIPVHRQIAATV